MRVLKNAYSIYEAYLVDAIYCVSILASILGVTESAVREQQLTVALRAQAETAMASQFPRDLQNVTGGRPAAEGGHSFAADSKDSPAP